MNPIYEIYMCLLDVRLLAAPQYLLYFSLVGTTFLFSVSVGSLVAAVMGLIHGPPAAGVHRRPGPGGGVNPTLGPGLSFF
jgi:hypothetical protein